MVNITLDRKVIFKGRTQDCGFCDDGMEYEYTETCATCEGKKRFLKGTRRYKCKSCNGSGYTLLKERIHMGDCHHCNGTQKTPLKKTDNVTDEDRLWIWENLFNLEKPYNRPTSSFNEGYLGLGIICGVTDYGRYQKMTLGEFKEEVRNSFMNHYIQYLTITKDDTLPQEILIKKGESGWFAYPVY